VEIKERVENNSIVIAQHELGYEEMFSKRNLLFCFFLGKKVGEKVVIFRGGNLLPSDNSVWVIKEIFN